MSGSNNNDSNKALAGRAVEEAAGDQMQLPTNSAAGMMGVVQHMLGTMQHAATAGQQEQQQQAGGPPTTYVPLDPGSLMQSTMTAAGGDTRTAVGADPNAHTIQAYDPKTNTLITTSVDPATGATTTTMTSSPGGGGAGGVAMASSRAFGGAAAAEAEPRQTARVTEVLDDEEEEDDPDT